MDLHFTSATATPLERAAVDAALQSHNGGTKGPGRRHLLLPLLHAVNERIGWISPGALNYVGACLDVPPADAYGVATFYKLLATRRPCAGEAPRVLHVCDDIACHCAGANDICTALESTLGPEGATDDDRPVWLRSPCLGLCERAPAALLTVAGEHYSAQQIAPITPTRATAIATGSGDAGALAAPQIGGSELRLLARVGRADPESLEAYCHANGYRGLRRAFEIGAEATIAEIAAAKLMGRGGAAFPTGRKIEAVARAAARPHYLICNADESEPGTFKDRVLMEQDPFAIIEAMTIAAYAAGCEYGYVYVRGEYPLAARRVATASEAARAAGLLGKNIIGTKFGFDIEVRRGAGAYICGEETALFNSIEGKRGEPRSKPPFPVDVGLFNQPTLINNVETLANLPLILRDGAQTFARTGTAESTGTRLFCVSGSIARPGLYELAHGATVQALIEMAGGVPRGRSLRAILLGGAAGTLVGPDALDLPLTFEDARRVGTTLGSGVVMPFDDTVDLTAILRRIARFFRDESCGQCVPCRVGTVRQEEALERLTDGSKSPAQRTADISLLDDIGRAMRDASICGLGQTAASVIASARRMQVI
ncbi:MAG: NAD(P)H-dependent oxidoreductase subunit E [Candidatus Eremiobacteraeota bacterium]|nr:NAD(P)H-dependent oxidoreductase subunit E [Candidatus Eremiobacteraeota bacterium]MBV9263633.1 NAD(P)H-dependent oxidoreductase subunit E [Candidatus Eremiobacteraeota bacterium]